MLKTQEYLRSGKSFDEMVSLLNLEVTRHDTLPLVILNYNQIESPKTHPIVRECRGLVLNSEDYSLVARSFSRFFNWGEVAEEMPLFQWDKATVQEKCDGSLVLIYRFDGKWRANTRGSFATGKMMNDYQADFLKAPRDMTWQQGFLRAMNINSLDELNGVLDPALTYVVEFCSLYNKVVREYKEPHMTLLTCFAGEEEVGAKDVPIFRKLKQYDLKTADEVLRFVADHPESTFEGCVVKDSEFRRWKLKNPRYLALHKIKGNGEALYLPSNLIPFVLENEGGELLSTYPEVTDVFNSYKAKVDNAYAELEALWKETYQIENQKDFALSILGKTPFTGVLFNVRKKFGKTQTLKNLKDEFRNPDMIVKVLFGK